VKIRGVLVGTAEEQRVGRHPDDIFPPERIAAEGVVPVLYELHDDWPVGKATLGRDDAGRVVFTAELLPQTPEMMARIKEACYGVSDLLANGTVMAVGLCRYSVDVNHPRWEEMT
jgi:hypothetical protein